MIALYAFDEGSGETVRDVSGVGEPLDLQIQDPDAVRWGDSVLTVDSPTVITSSGPATKVNNAIKFSNEFSVELWVTPDEIQPSGPGRLLTLSSSANVRNFTVGQGFWVNQPTARFQAKTVSTFGTGDTISGIASTGLYHVVYVRSDVDKQVRMYVNGVQVHR